MKWDGGYNTRYISFRNSKTDMRLGGLYINSLYNIPMKYEYIENIELLEKVTYQRKKTMLKEMILSIKYNEGRIFVAVEKEVGKHKNSAFLFIIPTMRMIVREWIKENMYAIFKCDIIKERKSLVKIRDFNSSSKYQAEL